MDPQDYAEKHMTVRLLVQVGTGEPVELGTYVPRIRITRDGRMEYDEIRVNRDLRRLLRFVARHIPRWSRG